MPSTAQRPPQSRQTGPRDNGQTLLTRRQILFGAAGIAAVAGVGIAGAAVAKSAEKPEPEITVLEVPEGAVSTTADCTESEADSCMKLVGEFELPYGTLIWANSNDYAACLLPTEVPSPLTEGAVLALGSGEYETILPKAASTERGFEIYDIRCNGSGVIWTEASCLTNEWRVFQASYKPGNGIGTPVLVEQGGTDFDMPHIAIAGSRVFWQLMPSKANTTAGTPSLVKCARIGSDVIEEALRSSGRMCTPLYATADSIVATPRANVSGVYHVLTRIDAESLAVMDIMTLPASMKPIEAGYVDGRFSFAFDAIYDYGGGIANLGTYVPASDGNPDTVPWFRFDRSPNAAPAWSGRWFMVKSSRSVSGIDVATNEVFSLPVPDGCDTYGDYLATTGTFDTIVTFSNIDTSTHTATFEEGGWNEDTGEKETGTYVATTTQVRHALVRVWTPAS